MAVKTDCQTKGVVFSTVIEPRHISVMMKLPGELNIGRKKAEELEANLHNALELVLKPYMETLKKK